MQGSENLRKRGKQPQASAGTIPTPSEPLDESSITPEGRCTEEMAGSTRIIRYVLFAFFVGDLTVWNVNSSLSTRQGITILFFITSSSSIPKPPIPDSPIFKGGKWNKHDNDPSSGLTSPSSASSGEQILVDERPAPGSATLAAGPTSNITMGAVPATGRLNATFVTLARNSDLWDIADSIRQVEDRFNRNYHYDWVFLNDREFDDDFKKVTTALVSGKTHYGTIPKEHWSFPDFIDQDKAKAVREDMAERKIIYGDSISYRHMCRFESGFFFRQPLMQNYEWYWRVEPSVKLYCDIGFDPFRVMAENKKKYSFVISLYEYAETIPTIWDSAKKFMKQYPEHVAKGNSMKWLSDDNGESYNHCHFVSPIEQCYKISS